MCCFMLPSLVENSICLAFSLWQKESVIVIGVKHKSTPYFRTNRRNSNLCRAKEKELIVNHLYSKLKSPKKKSYLEYRTIGAHTFKYVPFSLAF